MPYLAILLSHDARQSIPIPSALDTRDALRQARDLVAYREGARFVAVHPVPRGYAS